MKVELNLTERLFASLIGVRTTLMRPPYAIDEEPDTADQVRPLEVPQEMGYITVGNRIDPDDWSGNPSAEKMLSSYVPSHLPPLPSGKSGDVETSCCCMTAGETGPKPFALCPRLSMGFGHEDMRDSSGLRSNRQDAGGCDGSITCRRIMGGSAQPVCVLGVRRKHRHHHLDISSRRSADDRPAHLHWSGGSL